MTKGEKLWDNSLARFAHLARKKYDAGQKEHGGYLADRVSLRDIEEELIDCWFYVQALKEKISEARALALRKGNHL